MKEASPSWLTGNPEVVKDGVAHLTGSRMDTFPLGIARHELKWDEPQVFHHDLYVPKMMERACDTSGLPTTRQLNDLDSGPVLAQAA